jgi:hypothetical protein
MRKQIQHLAGNGPTASKSESRRAFPVRVGDPGKSAQAFPGAAGDLRQSLRLERSHVPQSLLFAIGEGAAADGFHFFGGEEALLARLRLGDIAAAVEDRVEAEFLKDGLAHQ